MTIILASQSPRRQELLKHIVPKFNVIPADIDETVMAKQSPKEYVSEMAIKKAEAIAKKSPNDLIIGCDTIVAVDTTILGKPQSREEAETMLKELSGRKHDVYTSIAVVKNGKQLIQTIHSIVEFYALKTEEINRYLETDEYKDKAGAYGIQGAGALFIKNIQGDYYAIMGLPISALYRMLDELG